MPDTHPATAQPAATVAMPPAVLGWFLALLALTTVLCLYDLDGGASFEPTDCWVAQTAREMSEGRTWRDFVVPRFSGETRMQKSPAPYWAVLAASWLRSEPVNEVTARLPNAVAAIVLVATIFWLTRRIAGDRAALFAGFAAMSSVFILYWSHRAASDLGLAACVTVSLACLWVACSAEPPGPRRAALLLLGYFAAGLGMLWKLPMPIACVGAPAFFYLLLCNRWRVLRSGWHLAGLVLFLLPWLPWALTVLSLEPTALSKWRGEYLDRFTGDMPNVQFQLRWFFYLYYALPPLIYCLPYSLSLPGALWLGLRGSVGRHAAALPAVQRDGLRFVMIWFFSLLAFFTAATGKELRYFLPAVPPLFVLLGLELDRLFDSTRPLHARMRLAALSAAAIVPIGFAAAGWGLWSWYRKHGRLEGFAWEEVRYAYAVAAGLFSLGAVITALLYARNRRGASFAVLVATMCVAWCWTWSKFMPIVASERPARDFAAQLRERIPPEYQSRMFQIAAQDSRVTWYSNYRWPRIVDQLALLGEQKGRRTMEYERRRIAEEAVRKLAEPDLVLLVASREHYVEFLTAAPLELAAEGRAMPRTYLWLQTAAGHHTRHQVLIGNRPPPWPEPPLTPPSAALQSAASQSSATRPAATGPAEP